MDLYISAAEYDYHTLLKVAEMAGLAGVISFHEAGDGYLVTFPQREGQALHHCVGTYIERVAAKKCLIVFVRRVEEPEKPFVTVEVSNGKIVQIRGERNSDPTKEVKKFVDLWSRKVLPMALQTA